ncbi:MAG: GTPase Era [Clostridia bacterium]|nr:GTPase Era [Clostridia bacterium]
MTHIVGYIAIVGWANAGKSTLLNSLIEQKVSIVSPKPQTTRDSIIGIWSTDDCQMVFVDTPGWLKPKNVLGEYMQKSIDRAVVGVDCIMLVIDGHDGIKERDIQLIYKYANRDIPLVVVISKTDITQPERLMPELARLNGIEGIAEIFCVSAKRNKNIDVLKEHLKKYLKEGPPYYPEDEVTNKSLRFLVCEQIREKMMLVLDNEVPHGIGVMLNKMEYDEDKMIWIIDANIIAEKQSHKPIILGKNGQMLKEISIRARASIEKLLQSRVYLELWVKVKPDWRNNQYLVTEIGYDKKDLD